jgi:nucleoside 2-deoxyribosyltransferase
LKVYLAGPISGLTFGESADWRVDVQQQLAAAGIDAYSPLRAKDYLDSEGVLEGAYEQHPLSSAKGILTRDRWDVQTSDLVLVNLVGTERISIGTVMEIAYADAKRTPVVLAMEPGNAHMHPMLEQASGFIVNTLEEAVAVTKAILLPVVA